MTWQEKALKLRLDQKRKIPHCSTDASAYISNSASGVRLYCFRCGASEFQAHGRLSASTVLEMRKRDGEMEEGKYPKVVSLYSDEATPAARVWLLRSGITPEDATDRYGMGYSVGTDRVIIPILNNGEPTGQWVGRAVGDRKPKYLMPRGTNGAVWYDIRPDTEAVVYVEDVLSAIKVVKAGISSASVLGTSPSLSAVRKLGARRVLGWFDNDAGGRKGWVNLRKVCAQLGLEPIRITSERDPKYYTKDEIRGYIDG